MILLPFSNKPFKILPLKSYPLDPAGFKCLTSNLRRTSSPAARKDGYSKKINGIYQKRRNLVSSVKFPRAISMDFLLLLNEPYHSILAHFVTASRMSS